LKRNGPLMCTLTVVMSVAFKELLAEDDAEGRAASHNPMERFSNHRTSERDAQGV
jgi:hypothetical protein